MYRSLVFIKTSMSESDRLKKSHAGAREEAMFERAWDIAEESVRKREVIFGADTANSMSALMRYLV